MKKLIYGEDLKPGDTFSLAGGPTHKTPGIRIEARECTDCGCSAKQVVRIDIPGGHQEVAPRTVVTLHHRPYPKGTDRGMMFHAVVVAAHDLVDAERGLTGTTGPMDALREALEAYDLGLTLEEMPIVCPPYRMNHRHTSDKAD